jgi:hypothetical protein
MLALRYLALMCCGVCQVARFASWYQDLSCCSLSRCFFQKSSSLLRARKHAIADGDPVAAGPGVRIFRPRYELAVTYGGAEFFRHTSVFILAFAVKDEAAFDQLWSDQSLRKVFTERQIQRTMWPIFRQHVLDGMTRMGIPGVVLPWLM